MFPTAGILEEHLFFNFLHSQSHLIESLGIVLDITFVICFNFPSDILQQRAVQERVGGGGAAEDHGLVGSDGHQAAPHAAAAGVKEHDIPRFRGSLGIWQIRTFSRRRGPGRRCR